MSVASAAAPYGTDSSCLFAALSFSSSLFSKQVHLASQYQLSCLLHLSCMWSVRGDLRSSLLPRCALLPPTRAPALGHQGFHRDRMVPVLETSQRASSERREAELMSRCDVRRERECDCGVVEGRGRLIRSLSQSCGERGRAAAERRPQVLTQEKAQPLEAGGLKWRLRWRERRWD